MLIQKPRHHSEVSEMVICRSKPRLFCAWPLLLYCIVGAFLLAFVPSVGFGTVLGFIFNGLFMMMLLIFGVDAKVMTLVIAILLGLISLLVSLVLSLTVVDVITPTFAMIYWACSFASSPQFFVSCSVAFIVAFVASWLETRTTWYEIRPNVIIRRRSLFGLFGASDIGRFDADGLRALFTINDVFEFWLLGVGRLELWPAAEKQAFVIENFPARLMPKVNHVLNANEVRLDPDNQV